MGLVVVWGDGWWVDLLHCWWMWDWVVVFGDEWQKMMVVFRWEVDGAVLPVGWWWPASGNDEVYAQVRQIYDGDKEILMKAPPFSSLLKQIL